MSGGEHNNLGRADLDHLVRAAHISPGEPLFYVRARDPAAGAAITGWIMAAHGLGAPPALLEQAFQRLDAFERWPTKRLPDADHLGEAERCQLEYQLGRRAWAARLDLPAAQILLAERRGWDAAMSSLRPPAEFER